MKHLKTGELFEVMNGGVVNGHLENCDECVEKLSALKDFQQSLTHASFLKLDSTESCLSPETIAMIVDCEDNIVTTKQIDHLENCDYCFESASYYFAESKSMLGDKIQKPFGKFVDGAIALMPGKQQELPTETVSIWSDWVERFVFAPFPAYASALILIVFVSIMPGPFDVEIVSNPEQYSIYSNPKNSQPFFFFGQKSEKVGSIPSDMKVVSGRRELKLYWNSVGGVEKYHIILQDVSKVAPRTIAQLKTSNTWITVSRNMIVPSTKYRWILAGDLPGDKYVIGQVEFTIVE